MKIRLLTDGEGGGAGNGMDLYRLIIPYCTHDPEYLKCISKNEFDFTRMDGDCYVLNRSREYYRAERIKLEKKKLIVDIDDYWHLPTWHNLHHKQLKLQVEHGRKYPDKFAKQNVDAIEKLYHLEKEGAENTIRSAKIADLVTVSTPMIQESLYNEHGIYSEVIPNTIHPDIEQFSSKKQPSKFVRFGWVGGAFHRRDIGLMYSGLRRAMIDPSINENIQYLSTFNDNPEYKEIEKMFTIDYAILDKDYSNYLQSYTRSGNHYGNNKPYKRLWSMPVTKYGYMYEEIDVALIPLHHGKFNSHKSELKLIEAGMTGCAAIVSNVMPYKPYLKHGYNCMVANGEHGWYTAIKILSENKELRETLAINLRKTIDQHFNFRVVDDKLRSLLDKL